MDPETTRIKIITFIREKLIGLQSDSLDNISEIQQWITKRKSGFSKNASQKSMVLAKNIFGDKYRCIADQQEFQYSNNLKALSLVIGEIAFQDHYICQRIISDFIKSNKLMLKIRNFPIEHECPPEQYLTIIKHSLLQLCEISEENTDIEIRDILGAYTFGLQIFSLILRGILMKLNYPEAEDYKSKQVQEKTAQIYTKICQYLDINIIIKDGSKKGPDYKNYEIYLFTDYNIFIIKADNSEFLCGIYFQNQQEFRGVKQTNQSYIQMISQRMDEGQARRQSISSMKISQAYFDFGMSSSGLLNQNKQQQSPYFNSNVLTPEFGFQSKQSYKFRKSVDTPAEYFAIEEQSQNMEASIKRKEYQYMGNQKGKYSNIFKDNTNSIIIDTLQEDKEEDKNKEIKDRKPKSPPTLAGVADLRFLKTEQKEIIKQPKKYLPFKKFDLHVKQRIIRKNNETKHPFLTPRQNLQPLHEALHPEKSNHSKSQPKKHKLSLKQKNCIFKTKQQVEVRPQEASLLPFETFSKSSKLQKVLSQIQLRKQTTDQRNKSNSKSQKNILNCPKNPNGSFFMPSKSISDNSMTSKISKNNNLVLQEPVQKNYCITNPKGQNKFRKYSDNRFVQHFQSIGSRSQNLAFNNNFCHPFKKQEESSIRNNQKSQQHKQLSQQPLYLGCLQLKKHQTSPDTWRKNKNNQINKQVMKMPSKNIGKFPEFLRNKRSTKKFSSNMSGEKKVFKDQLKLLKLPENKRSSQQSLYIRLQNSPRDLLTKNNSKEKQHIRIKDASPFLKSKNTQSYPCLTRQTLNSPNIMTNSIIPQTHQFKTQAQKMAPIQSNVSTPSYSVFNRKLFPFNYDRRSNINTNIQYHPDTFDRNQKQYNQSYMIKSNGLISSGLFNHYENSYPFCPQITLTDTPKTKSPFFYHPQH